LAPIAASTYSFGEKVIVLEAEYFTVEVPSSPHVDRLDGGHLVIYLREKVKDRTQLFPAQAIELMKLTMIVGEAMEKGLNRRGIDVVRINYQDNGNWGFHNPDGPFLHMHLYGRARSAKIQKHGEALYLPREEVSFYAGVQPLDAADVAEIRGEIDRLMATEKYRNFGSVLTVSN
jgi:diadenosine tetraphosphate (Ap4A) HIT family hydrolase